MSCFFVTFPIYFGLLPWFLRENFCLWKFENHEIEFYSRVYTFFQSCAYLLGNCNIVILNWGQESPFKKLCSRFNSHLEKLTCAIFQLFSFWKNNVNNQLLASKCKHYLFSVCIYHFLLRLRTSVLNAFPFSGICSSNVFDNKCRKSAEI